MRNKIAVVLSVFLSACTSVHAAENNKKNGIEFADGLATYIEKDYAKAFSITRPLAEAGDMFAQDLLAAMHHYGKGTEKDMAQAIHWYRQAAEQGHEQAGLELTGLLPRHQDLARDRDEVLYWLKKYKTRNNDHEYILEAVSYFDGRIPKDAEETYRWYAAKAAAGDDEAAFRACMFGGSQSVDPKAIWAWCEMLADKGDRRAQFYMGWRYLPPEGLFDFRVTPARGPVLFAPDAAKGLAWYRKAAENGDGRALAALALFHATGKAVPRDDAKAFDYARRASEAGSGDGDALLGALLAQGRGAPRDDARAVELLTRGYMKGAFMGGCVASSIYLHGRGVETDFVEAAAWHPGWLPKEDYGWDGPYGDLLLQPCSWTHANVDAIDLPGFKDKVRKRKIEIREAAYALMQQLLAQKQF